MFAARDGGDLDNGGQFVCGGVEVVGLEQGAQFGLIGQDDVCGLGDEIQQFSPPVGTTFGANPKGHKLQQGDERTPEGQYLLDYKNANSLYYKSIHISYPNERDRQEARRLGVDPGGDIMIHGQKNGYEGLSFLAQWFNWTNGCIALTNKDMDSVWEAVPPGTPIEIRP